MKTYIRVLMGLGLLSSAFVSVASADYFYCDRDPGECQLTCQRVLRYNWVKAIYDDEKCSAEAFPLTVGCYCMDAPGGDLE